MPTRISYDGMSRLTAAGYLENGKRNDHFSTSYKYDHYCPRDSFNISKSNNLIVTHQN